MKLKQRVILLLSDIWLVIVLVFISTIVAKAIVKEHNFLILGAVIFPIILLLNAKSPIKYSIKIVIIISFFWDYTVNILELPGKFDYILYFFIYFLFFITIWSNQRRSISSRFPFKNQILVLIIFTFCGFGLYHPPLDSFVLSMTKFWGYIAFFYILISTELSLKEEQFLVYFVIGCAFLQIPASIIQKYIFYPHFSTSADNMAGIITYGAGGANSIFLPSVAMLVLSLHNFFRNNFKMVSGILLFIIPLFIGRAGIGLLLIVFASGIYLLFTFFLSKKRVFRTLLWGSIITFLVFFLTINYYTNWHRETGRTFKKMIFSPHLMYEYGSEIKEGVAYGRIANIEHIWSDIYQNYPGSWIFGVGPGTFEVHGVLKRMSNIFKRHPLIRSHTNELSNLLLKVGLLGTVIYLYMILKCFVVSLFVYKRTITPFIKAISFAMMPITVIYFVGMLHKLTFSWMPLASTYWFLFSVV